MFYIKYSLKKSKLHRIGLFAEEEISKNQRIYKENCKLNLSLSKKELLNLTKDEQRIIKHYGYFDKRRDRWHLSFDDIRFCNHSSNGNVSLRKGFLIAKRNIKKGEELTQDYREFENLRDELKK